MVIRIFWFAESVEFGEPAFLWMVIAIALHQHTSGFFLLSQVLPDIRLHGYRESIKFCS